MSSLASTRDVLAVYTLGRGITFPAPSMREAAMRLLGLEAARAQAANPLAAALAGLAGGQGDADDDPFTGARRPAAALDLLERLLLAAPAQGRVAVIVEGADLICADLRVGKGAMSPDDRTVLATLRHWATDRQIARADNPILLFSRELTDVHADLREATSGYKAITIPMPTREGRVAFVQWYLGTRAAACQPIPLDGIRAEEIGTLTAGLSLRHIEDILLLGAQAGGVSRELVKARKDAIIASDYTEVAEMIEPIPDAALGGAARLRAWAQDEVIAPLRAGRVDDAPKGVLLVGPPGTGKTHFVRWLSQAVGFNAVALRSENILGGIVGESEKKLKTFFGFVRSLAPCLVFMDELDQSDMSRRGTGSGNPVASNLFNQMLQFMSDETLRGTVIVVFATNRPDLIDSALLRFGRIDAIIPVLLPDAAERAAIITAQARSQGAQIAVPAVAALAGATPNYSAADLGAVVRKARVLARREGRDTITPELAHRALSLIRPNSPATADYYTLLAVNACNDAEHLPPEYAGLLADRTSLQEQIAAVSPDAPRGADGPRRGRAL
ncbi:ATP-binding protein [Chloroflexales bacterium ZM16-3]|nr:ATP-binding protein [Chloroflexales bacterium ZM16-3]